MSRSARTMLPFGIYLVVLGATLVLAPNALFSVFGIPATREVWIRVVGTLVLVLGYYYVEAARQELRPFFRLSVQARPVITILFLGYVLAGLAPPVLVLFGLVDLAGAIWTASAMRAEHAAHAAGRA